MFRDLYKAAFDEITPNNELLEKILSAPELGNRKKHSLRNIYSYCSVAAAVFLVAISLYLYPHLQEINAPQNQDFNAVDKTAPQIKNEPAKNEAGNPEAVNPTISQPSQETPSPEIFEPAEEPVETGAPEAMANNAAADEKVSEDTAPAPLAAAGIAKKTPEQQSDDTSDTQDMSADMQMKAFGAGMGTEINYKLFTSEEYCKYLGLDIQRIADIPDGLRLTSPKETELAVDENGEMISDEWTYIYEENENRQIFITTTRHTDGLEEIIRNEGSKEINGSKYITFDYGDSKAVYMVRQDIGITIWSTGIALVELDRLTASLTK